MNSLKNLFYVVVVLVSFTTITACQNTTTENASSEAPNPAMPDFNTSDSDEKAIGIADEVMEAMGGRKNWDNTRYLVWDFFGNRKLYWDKHTGDVRIEFLKEDLDIIMNIHTMEGSVSKENQELTNPDSIRVYLDQGKGIWINDSYWLVMPFKLKDSGVTLKYLREDTLRGGIPAQVLQLTFDQVGNTPENKYEIYVDPADHLVKQWAYFRNADQDSANFIRPWDNYKTYGSILLSADRSDNGGPGNVLVPESLPEGTFTSFDPVQLQ